MTSIEHRPLPTPSAIAAAGWRTPVLIIGFGCLISLMSFGPRSSLGFFLTPMSSANHWGRDVFGFALALQNLLWGIGQPIAGMIADRYGSARVLCAGGLMYAAGLALMSQAASAPVLDVSAGVLIGFGLSGTSFMVVLAAFGKLLPPAMALACVRLWHRGRLVRPVPVFTDRRRTHGRFRLAADADHLRRQHARHPPGVAGADDADGGRQRGGNAIAAQRTRRGLRPPLLPAAGGRLFHLRISARVHHRTHAVLSDRSRTVRAGRRLDTGLDRTVQHHRIDYVRLARRSHAQALSAVVHLFGPRGGDPGVHLVSGHAVLVHRVRRGHGSDVAVNGAAD